MVEKTMEEKIRYSENGRSVEASVVETIVRKIAEKALTGDLKAAGELLGRYAAIQAKKSEKDEANSQSIEEIDANDKAMLAALFPAAIDGETDNDQS